MMSTAGHEHVETPATFGVGADLRAARLRIGWDLPDCAAMLRIRLAYLSALEAGRLGELPGYAYALGFLRTYGAALGLDPDELSRRFKAEAALVNRKTKLDFPAPMPERGIPAGAVVLLGAVLAIGAYVGWYRLSGEGRLPAETVPEVPARLAPLADQAVPLSTPPQAPSPAAVAAPVEEDPGPPMPAYSPSSAAAAMPPPVVVPPSAVVPASASGSAVGEARVVLRARADSWLEVRDRSGQVILNRVLHPGESWPVPDRPGLVLTTGNAGGTDVVLDGTTVISLAGQGAVRHNLPLDPDAIKDGRLTAAAQPAAATPAPAALATTPAPTPARGAGQ
jgi:cytoskeleton protein RodZ